MIYIAIIFGAILIGLLIYSLNDYTQVKRRSISFKESLDLTGLPIITFENNEHKFNFLLDTGAIESLINKDALKDMTYTPLPIQVNVFGVDGIDHKAMLCKSNLTYKNQNYECEFLMHDMSAALTSLKNQFGVTVHGIIGSKFFSKYKYILDFDELIAYSSKNIK